jgi:hypothetical protein
MAKAKAKKRTAKQNKELVKRILKESTSAVMAGVGTKKVGEKARKFWLTRGLKNIKIQVEAGVDWDKARKRVLPTAKKMGRVASVLTGEFRIIPPWAAEAASVAVKFDPKCPNVGRGGFCP